MSTLVRAPSLCASRGCPLQVNKRNEANTDGVLHGLRATIGDLQATVSTFGAEAQSRAAIVTTFVEDVVSRKAAEIRALSQDLEQAGLCMCTRGIV